MQNVANITVTSANSYNIKNFVVLIEMQSKQISENDNLCYNHRIIAKGVTKSIHLCHLKSKKKRCL